MLELHHSPFPLAYGTHVKRSEFYRKLRYFFETKDFLEVETPILNPSLIPETAIEVFRADFVYPYEGTLPFYLTPSPEIFMKELLSQDLGSLYQITKSFRNAESASHRHNPEFTMLEWYGVGMNYRDNIQFTGELLSTIFPLAAQEVRVYLELPPHVMSMREAFSELVGMDLDRCINFEDLKREAERAGYVDSVVRSENWEELFNFIFIVISPQDSVASGRGCRGVCFLASNQEIVAVLYTV